MAIAKKDTFLTTDECAALADVMQRKYASLAGRRQFLIEAKKETRGVYAKVTLRNESGSFFYPVEGRIADIDHDLTPREACLLVLDYIDAYYAEYLREGGDVYLPIDWAEYEVDGIPLQLKGQILNLEVENMADDWLNGLRPVGNAAQEDMRH